MPGETAMAFGQRLARLGPRLARGAIQGISAGVVAPYWAIGHEVPTRPPMDALHGAGFTVALPVTGALGTALTFRLWTPRAVTVPGRMAIPEPPADAPELVPDVLFVPLAAFDRRGQRVGTGAGYYDRTLAGLRAAKDVTAIGLAYGVQEALFIPTADHDEPLDLIVTEVDTLVIADED